MTERERLIELLKQNCHCKDEDCAKCSSKGFCFTHRETDYILADGWIRPPCKAGEVVWINTKFGTLKARVTEITQTINNKFLVHIVYDLMYCYKQHINTQGYVGYLEDKFEFGKTAYHTKEEAEKALKGDGKS